MSKRGFFVWAQILVGTKRPARAQRTNARLSFGFKLEAEVERKKNREGKGEACIRMSPWTDRGGLHLSGPKYGLSHSTQVPDLIQTRVGPDQTRQC